MRIWSLTILLGACNASHPIVPIVDDAGHATPDAGPIDAGADAGPIDAGRSRWSLDQGARALGGGWPWVTALIARGDQVALVVERISASDEDAELDAYVETPWSRAWADEAWSRPEPIAQVAAYSSFALSWDGAAFFGAVRDESSTTLVGPVAGEVIDRLELQPVSFSGDAQSYIVGGSYGSHAQIHRHTDGVTELIYDGCANAVATAADGTRRWLARSGCPRESDGLDVVIEEIGGASQTVHVTDPELVVGEVRVLRLLRARNGMWLVDSAFAGLAGGSQFRDDIAVFWIADGEPPRRVCHYHDQDGSDVTAAAVLGDRLVLSFGGQDNFGDLIFTLVDVGADGANETIVERNWAGLGHGPPLALLGSPDGRELLVASLDPELDHLEVTRLRRSD